MLFKFFKYIQPIWYYNLPSPNSKIYFPDYDALPKKLKASIKFDTSYSCHAAALKDAAYQAWQKGVMCVESDGKDVVELPVALVDEYRFIRKYFKSFWTSYVFILRMLSLHNPVKEWAAYRISKRVSHFQFEWTTDVGLSPVEESKFEGLVSIVIPTLNRYDYLKDILADLEVQRYKNFEVIVVDQSDNIQDEFYEQFNLPLTLIKLQQKGQWNARNTAIKQSKGDFIAFTEDDVRIDENWISAHLMTIEAYNADISCGLFYPAGEPLKGNSTLVRYADQFASGNAMVKREVFQKIGLFDMQFEKMRMGDGEFGLRAYLNRFLLVSNPLAACIDVKAPVGGLREMGSWDGYRPKSLFSPRPIPSILYYFRKYYGNQLALYSLFKNVPPSIVPYKFKRRKSYLLIGSVLSIFLMPFILIQVVYSWHLSSKMLKEGPLIDEI